MDLIVLVCLRYIGGQALESLSFKFHVENASVNASACEFLELLITHIEDRQLSTMICNFVMKRLLNILKTSISNKDYVMQVQLLNMFKTIFFHSAFTQKNNLADIKYFLGSVLECELFIPSIVMGLYTPIAYMRNTFVNFISSVIILISDYVNHPRLSNIMKSILFHYY